MAEDAYQGDAQFTVSMDGVQLGGTFTTTASQSAGVKQNFVFDGNWAAGSHTVTVTFLNDAYGGSSSADRNLYVDGVAYDGTNTGQSGALYSDGSKNFTVNDTTSPGSTPPPSVTTGTGPDSLVLNMAEDAYQGDAQFTVSMDGVQLGGTFTTTASQSAGVKQNFIFNGNWAAGAHTVTVTFLNDAYGGSASTDRNLYVDGVTYDGVNTGQSAALYSNGSKSFVINDATAHPAPSTTTTSAGTPGPGDQASFIGGSSGPTIVADIAPDARAIGVNDVLGSFVDSGDPIDLLPTLSAAAPQTLDTDSATHSYTNAVTDQHQTSALSFGDALRHDPGS
jgi:hypothetical protein